MWIASLVLLLLWLLSLHLYLPAAVILTLAAALLTITTAALAATPQQDINNFLLRLIGRSPRSA
jgi:hypothetical protein